MAYFAAEAPVAPARGRAAYDMSVAKDRQHNSAAKSLLYGGGADEAPHREGKKSVPHARGSGAPFATYDAAAVPVPGADSRAGARQAKKDAQGAGKIGAVEFDASVYAANRAANAANSAALKSKNWGSGQVMHSDAPKAPAGYQEPAAHYSAPDHGAYY